MFDKLTERLQGVIEGLRGRGRLTEDNITDTLRQVRMALLEADVALPVVKTFVETVKTKVVGQEIEKSLTPGQALVSLIHQELIALMGEGVRPLNLRAQPPVENIQHLPGFLLRGDFLSAKPVLFGVLLDLWGRFHRIYLAHETFKCHGDCRRI